MFSALALLLGGALQPAGADAQHAALIEERLSAGDAAFYGGLFALGLALEGTVLGAAVGTFHETSCFGDARAAAERGAGGGAVVGLAAIPVFVAVNAARDGARTPGGIPGVSRRRGFGKRLLVDAVVHALAGVSIGAVAGALEASGNPACGGSGQAAGRGALLFGAAGAVLGSALTLADGAN